ncbi:hypothetical protein, partial [Sphingomonas sp.]|uniref:hypothetical protein n=1 Tax=Sphingomonas sp. TaxID=28214 RepID=UPI0025D46668
RPSSARLRSPATSESDPQHDFKVEFFNGIGREADIHLSSGVRRSKKLRITLENVRRSLRR